MWQIQLKFLWSLSVRASSPAPYSAPPEITSVLSLMWFLRIHASVLLFHLCVSTTVDTLVLCRFKCIPMALSYWYVDTFFFLFSSSIIVWCLCVKAEFLHFKKYIASHFITISQFIHSSHCWAFGLFTDVCCYEHCHVEHLKHGFLCTGWKISPPPPAPQIPRGGILGGTVIVVVSQSCLTLCDPMDCSMPGFPVLHHLPEFAQTHVC